MLYSRPRAAFALIVAALVISSAPLAVATTYSITVQTDAASYSLGQTVKITGSISPAPGPSTAVSVRVYNPASPAQLVAVIEAGVDHNGNYNCTLVTGGSSAWVTGTYKVNATWGAYPPTISKATTFMISSSVTTTTTSSTTSTSTSSTSTTSTSSTSSTSSSSSSTSTTSSTSSSTSTTPTTTSTTSSGGGGIPEFPYQATAAVAFAAVLVAAYVLVRTSISRRPAVPGPR